MTIEEYIDKLLINALDCGITEKDFWEMTIGEVVRQIQSYNKLCKIKAQEKASYDYIQASVIIKGISIILGSKEHFPTIQEVYPTLFDDVQKEQEEKIQKQKDNVSALRFKQFAQSYNNRMKNKGVQTKNE